MACAVFTGLSVTAVVSNRTIAIGALLIAAVAIFIGAYLLASTLSATNPFHLIPPRTSAIGAATYLILGAGVASLIVGVAALLPGKPSVGARRVPSSSPDRSTAVD